MAHTGAMHGVIQAEEVALNIADGEQTIDGLVFFRAPPENRRSHAGRTEWSERSTQRVSHRTGPS